jgi:hypothetical protein
MVSSLIVRTSWMTEQRMPPANRTKVTFQIFWHECLGIRHILDTDWNEEIIIDLDVSSKGLLYCCSSILGSLSGLSPCIRLRQIMFAPDANMLLRNSERYMRDLGVVCPPSQPSLADQAVQGSYVITRTPSSILMPNTNVCSNQQQLKIPLPVS